MRWLLALLPLTALAFADAPAKPKTKITPGQAVVPLDNMRRLWGELVSLDLKTRTGTFRNEGKYLAGSYNKDPIQEFLTFYRLGVDGVFTDFSNTGYIARLAYLRELGR